ncbi:MAG: YIP1 family protein [Oscillospiraceae bacterium]
MYDFTRLGWLKHCIYHPLEGFEDLRWKKEGSLRVAMAIVLLLFIAMVANRQLIGFAFNSSYVKVFNVVPLLVRSVVYFFSWVIANWAVCTLFSGEGTMRKICIYSAYALVPYVVCVFVIVALSNVLIIDEAVWLMGIYYFGMIWSVLLMFNAIKAVHQYSVIKTAISIFLTIVVMLIILFLAVLLLSLFQQVMVFGFSIYTEIAYRIRG